MSFDWLQGPGKPGSMKRAGAAVLCQDPRSLDDGTPLVQPLTDRLKIESRV